MDDIQTIFSYTVTVSNLQSMRLLCAHNLFFTGVSEGQYEAVLKYELRPIEERCRSLYPRKGDLPKITIVVVGKRHHTRFYPTDQKFVDTFHKDNNEILYNCKPGTVVDRGITMLKGWDFFLQSHAAIKGTVSVMSQMTRILLNTD